MLNSFYKLYSCLNIGIINNSLKCFIINTKINRRVLYLLWISGYINGFYILSKKKLVIFFKYKNNKSGIRFIKPISTPGKRVFIKVKHCKFLLQYNGLCGILSTNKGVMTHNFCFLKKTAGEFLCIVY